VEGWSGGGAAPKLDSGGDVGSSILVSSSAAKGGAEGVRDSGITLVSAAEITDSAARMTDKQPDKIFGDRHAKVKGTTAPL
jgi:hypothetical protein